VVAVHAQIQIMEDGRGEKLLLAAILRRAAYDIALYRGETELWKLKIWKDAHDWMFHGEDNRYLSFHHICYLLDQNAMQIRRKTLRLTKQDVRKYDMVESNGRV